MRVSETIKSIYRLHESHDIKFGFVTDVKNENKWLLSNVSK